MSKNTTLKKAERYLKIKAMLPLGKTYEEIAEACRVTRRTINRDIEEWKENGEFEKWLLSEFFRLHEKIIKTDPRLAYDQITNLLKSTIEEHLTKTQKLEMLIVSSMPEHDNLTETENEFFNVALQHNWCVVRGGEPDFLCIDPSGILHWVEVKSKTDQLSERQKTYHEILKNAGLNIHVYRGDWSFQ